MNTTSAIATIAADLADWLASRSQRDLPPVYATHISTGFTKPGASIQLAGGTTGVQLADLADWAEHLDIDVVLAPGHNGRYIRAAIEAPLGSGTTVELWTHIEGADRDVVEDLLFEQDRGPIACGTAVSSSFLLCAAERRDV